MFFDIRISSTLEAYSCDQSCRYKVPNEDACFQQTIHATEGRQTGPFQEHESER